jgi:hypothetical protein
MPRTACWELRIAAGPYGSCVADGGALVSGRVIVGIKGQSPDPNAITSCLCESTIVTVMRPDRRRSPVSTSTGKTALQSSWVETQGRDRLECGGDEAFPA